MILNPCLLTDSAESVTPSRDLESIARRIVQLAELAALAHIEAIAQSQADGLLRLLEDLES